MLINVNIIIARYVIPFTTCAFIFFHFHEDLVRSEWMEPLWKVKVDILAFARKRIVSFRWKLLRAIRSNLEATS